MFDVRLEDLIDFHFPGGGSGGFVGFWSGDGWPVWFGGRRVGGCRWGADIRCACGFCCGLVLYRFGRGLRGRCGWLFEYEVGEHRDGGGEGWDDEFPSIHKGRDLISSWVGEVIRGDFA